MNELREQCQHRWPDIFSSFGVDDRFTNKKHQPCPLCGGKDRARFTDYTGSGAVICNGCAPESIDGIEFLMRFTGKDFKTLALDIREILGETQARPVQNMDVEKQRQKLNEIWSGAKPLSKGCPTHRYLLNRGLAGLEFSSLHGIRCHEGLTYWHVEDGKPMNLGKFPAMVGLITTPDGLPSSVHCTYLTLDGRKAALDPVRKMMTPTRPISGGAVRLQELKENQVLCVAEGIETALAMKLHYPDVCPWAVISAGNMEKFVPPNNTSGSIYVAADNDGNYTGQAAAYALAKRLSLKKYKASVLMPEKKGDFLDQLNYSRAVAS